MKINPQLGIAIVIIILIIVGAVYFLLVPKSAISPTMATSTPVTSNTVLFSCDMGSFTGVFGSSTVALTLSDGRSFTLPQTISGSGIRYESTSTPNEDIVLNSEGNDAFITENGKVIYNNCVAGTTASSTGTNMGTSTEKTFTDQGNTFSFTYPSQFNVSGGGVGYSNDWMVNATTSGMVLAKLVIPSSFEPKTNFGDATFTIGTSADLSAVAECTTYAESGGAALVKSQVTINGVTYTKFVTSDAGAGNIYQTTSYRTIRNSQCYAIEYTIHSANIQNYSPDQGITAFDQNKVQSLLEAIVQSLRFK
jgi:membrane-bound inhibitor of C-type lysozyme